MTCEDPCQKAWHYVDGSHTAGFVTGTGRVSSCPKWPDRGHNDVIVRGTVLFWRRYAVCCACGSERRFR